MIVVAVLIGLTIWITPNRVTIKRVFLDDRDTNLQAWGWADSCGGWLWVAVRETSTEVRVTVRDYKPGIRLRDGANCGDDDFAFTLNRPLGDRALVDGATGESVRISKGLSLDLSGPG